MYIFRLIASSKYRVSRSLVSLVSNVPVQPLTSFQPISGRPQYLHFIRQRRLQSISDDTLSPPPPTRLSHCLCAAMKHQT